MVLILLATISIASRSSSVPVITLNGVSKVYYALVGEWIYGFTRSTNCLVGVKDAIERLLRSRLCASIAQMGYLAGLNNDRGWMNEHGRM